MKRSDQHHKIPEHAKYQRSEIQVHISTNSISNTDEIFWPLFDITQTLNHIGFVNNMPRKENVFSAEDL